MLRLAQGIDRHGLAWVVALAPSEAPAEAACELGRVDRADRADHLDRLEPLGVGLGLQVDRLG